MENRIFVIGIDGATFKIIDHMVEQGKLPNLNRFRQQGASGVLTSTIPTVSPVAWTSFMTGMNPENHQIFDFTGKDPKTHGFRFNNATHRQAPPIWMKLSEYGKRCLVVGVTMTYPPDPVNGYMISGLGAPIDRHRPSHTYPRELADEIDRKIGKYRITPEVNFRKLSRSARERDKYVKAIATQIEQRVELFQYLWRKDRFDFAMLFFLDTDGASHYLWRYMDKTSKNYVENRHADAIFQIYEHIDTAIGRLLKIVNDDEADIIILSDHGFGPLNRVVFMNNLLKTLGYLKFKQDVWLRKTYSKFKPGAKAGPTIVWSETQAYFNGTFGNIYINLKGREPGGAVEPAQYDDLRDRLIADLKKVKDPKTGEDVIEDL